MFVDLYRWQNLCACVLLGAGKLQKLGANLCPQRVCQLPIGWLPLVDWMTCDRVVGHKIKCQI